MPEYRSRGKHNKKRMPSGGRGVRKKNRTPVLVIILNVMIAIMTVIFLIAGAAFIKAHQEERGMLYFSDRYIFRRVEEHAYAELAENYYYDHADFRDVDPAYAEAAAVARYADAAFLLAGYTAMGDTAAADRQREVMEKSRQEVSLYLPELDRIDDMAGIRR